MSQIASRVQNFSKFALGSSLVTLGLASVCLVGWFSRVWILASFGANKIQMAPSTGLCFLLLGGILFGFSQRRGPRSVLRVIASGLTWVVVLVSLSALVWALVGVDSPLDAFLSGTDRRLFGVPQGRMSPISAVLFLVVCAGVLVSGHRSLAAGFFFLELVAGSFLVITYWYSATLFFDRAIIPPALPTSLGFLTLGAGFFSLVGSSGRLFRWWSGPSRWALISRGLYLALLIVGIASDLRETLVMGLGRSTPYLTYYPGVLIAAIVGGPGAGLAATLASVALTFGWIQQGFLSTSEAIGLGLFTLSCLLIVGVVRALRRSEANAARAKVLAEAQAAQLRTLLDTLPDLVWMKDVQGQVVACNRRFEQLTGVAENQILGKTDEFFRPNFLKAVTTKQRVMNEQEVVFADDGHREFLETIHSPVFDSAGTLLGVLAIGRNISDRKANEEQRLLYQAQMLQDQKMENLGVLAGGVAHDMNNVLAAILSLVSVRMLTLVPTDPSHRTLEKISKAAQRGGKLIQRLLSFARKEPLEKRNVDVNALVREAVGQVPQTSLSLINLKANLEPGLKSIQGDPNALVQILVDLFANALDAMPEAGTLSITTANLDDGQVEIQVLDTGIGMTPQVLEKSTNPFFTTKPTGKGTGLGLSMAYNTVLAHQGQLKIESEPGQGTLVQLRFPVVGSTVLDGIGEGPGPVGREAGGPPLRILLVDDDEMVREAVCETLEILNHRVDQASSGEEALDLLQKGLEFDVVILDLNMPGMGGGETLARLRVVFPRLPVLLTTGRTDQTALDLIEAFPLTVLLPKPYSLGELRQMLKLLPSLPGPFGTR